MARTSGSPLGKWRGRVGDKSFYVRHGKQIVFEPNRASRRPVPSRQLPASAALKMAVRWRLQLADAGITVGTDIMLKWAHAILRVARSGVNEAVVDSGLGGWALSRVSLDDMGRVGTSFGIHGPGTGLSRTQYFGFPYTYQPGFPTSHIYDASINIYPSGCRFVSIVGSSVDDLVIAIGVRIDYTGPIVDGYRTPSSCNIYSGNLYDGKLYLSVAPSGGGVSVSRVYTIDGWVRPNAVIEGRNVLAWGVIGGDGVPIDLAVATV